MSQTLLVFRYLVRGLFALVMLVSLVAVPRKSARAAVFVVDSLADSGPGTLRQAVIDANSNPGADVIAFDVDGVIALTSSNGLALQITDDLTIDGAGHAVTVDGMDDSPIFWAFGSPDQMIQVDLRNLTLINGSGGMGGAFNTSYSNTNLDRITFEGNFAHTGGAVAVFFGSHTITNSTFSGNGTNTAGGLGGDGSGGAVWVGANATNDPGGTVMVIANSTFTGNTSRNAGAVLMNQNGDVTLINTTISGNTTTDLNTPPLVDNGAVFNFNLANSRITLRNTIVANNEGGNCVNAITDGGNNLTYPVTDTSCPGTNADPQLAALVDNGGPTRTMRPLEGSPAIDAGNNAICAAPPVNNLDQRGVTRLVGSVCDIGAVEFEPDLFDFDGFFPPVRNPGPGPDYVINRFKAGTVIPVRFSLNGNQGLDILAEGYPVSQQISCDLVSEGASEPTNPSGRRRLIYLPGRDQYTYFWVTKYSWRNTCRKLTVRLTDHSEHIAYFRFVR